MKHEVLKRIQKDRADRRPVVLATHLDTGEQRLVYPFEEEGATDAEQALVDAARHALEADRSVTLDRDDGRLFLQVFNPPVRLVLVGAVHISQPLAQMATLAGFDVVVVDPRTAFASEERFPGVELRAQWPDEALPELGINRRTAVVTLTHDPKVDDPALQEALRSPAFIIGALGSRRTHAARLARLREAGFGDEDLARIHGPVGLDIGARTPAEIAVAVLAQIIEHLRSDSE